MPNVSSSLRPEWLKIPQQDFRNQLRQLTSLRELAHFWGVRPFQLSFYTYVADKRSVYNSFSIPRRNGGKRSIEVPDRTLKYIQRLIHESLARIYGPHPAVHGFLTNRSIVTNASNHLGRRYVLNIDLEDFFPSITRKRIYGRLVAEPYSLNSKVAQVIAGLSTNVYLQLPQGSPSSPVIANIVAAGLDAQLARLSASFACRYTRYADDITISTSSHQLSPHLARYPSALGTGQVILGDRLVDLVERHGFKINHRKSRLQSHWTRQMCTGLVVNGSQVSVRRSYIRRLRSLVDHWKKNGWKDAAQVLHTKEHRRLFNGRQQLKDHVLGRIGYIRMVRGQDDQITRRLANIVATIPSNH